MPGASHHITTTGDGMKATQRVIYRAWPNGTVTALLPDQEHGPYIGSYEHIGQHGMADYSFVMGKTTAATREQYAELHRELTGPVGYRLRVVPRRRRTRKTPKGG